MIPLLDGCQNPKGCRSIATKRIRVIDAETDETCGTRLLCAYCVDKVAVPKGYRIAVSDLEAAESTA